MIIHLKLKNLLSINYTSAIFNVMASPNLSYFIYLDRCQYMYEQDWYAVHTVSCQLARGCDKSSNFIFEQNYQLRS